jgi:hypothetical protein
MILFAIILIATAVLVSAEYGWRGALLYTVAVGFLQDPIRKVAEGSTYYGGLAFACFLITFIALKSVNRYWYATYLFWTNQKLITLLPIFYYLIGFQALNSFARIGDIRLSIIGMLFYTLPLLALWVGFHLGKNQVLLREFLRVYVILCSLCAISVLLDAQGVQNPLFNEVGKGLGITGIGEGNSGLWRTSEIAGWHLAAGACFAFILGMTSKNTFNQNTWFFLTIGLTFLTTTTGRRKALGIVIVFIALFLLYYSFSSQKSKIFRIVSSIFLVIILSFSSYGLIFDESSQENLDKYEERTSTLTLDESQNRFNSGIQRLIRGIEIAGPFGFGVGAGTNTGNTGISTSSLGQQSLGYVTEGGGGRIVAELGYLGAIFFLYVIFQLGLLYYRNFKLGLIEVPPDQFNILVGLLLFVVANAVSFFQAAQLYSDLFVLIVIGISFGCFLAVPVLASQFNRTKSSVAR